MTLAAFIAVFVAAALHYHVAGPLFMGQSIYQLAFWAVLAACVASLVMNRETRREQWATCSLLAINMVLGWKAWGTADPVFWHAVLHVTIAGIIVVYAQTRGSLIVAGLFLFNVALATLEVAGILPDRPRVFTGVYYADLVAYSGHTAMIITAGGSGDVGKRIRDILEHRPMVFALRRDRVFDLVRALRKVEKM